MTVNCARIIHGNQVATNGVVHVVDRVVSTVSSTIKDTLEVDDDLTSFSVRTAHQAAHGGTIPHIVLHVAHARCYVLHLASGYAALLN